jgi:guanylate kinase
MIKPYKPLVMVGASKVGKHTLANAIVKKYPKVF